MKVSHRVGSPFLMIFLAATLQAGSAAEPEQGSGERSIEHGGLARTYRIHVPPSYDGVRPMPLVFVFHGGGGTSLQMERGIGFNPLADKHGFLVVYPQGVENHWNDGRIGPRFPKAHEIDDVGFVRVLIDRLMNDHKIDAQRIYSTGISNGGFFSHRLGWELSDRLAAIAPVAGTLDPASALKFAPAHPVHVLDIHGTKDRSVPYEGGAVIAKGGECISVPAMIGLWVKANGCKEGPKVEYLAEKAPADGTRVRQEAYAAGAKGAEVILDTVEGLGHNWPGHTPTSEPAGPGTHQIDASEVIWRFFENHPKVRPSR